VEKADSYYFRKPEAVVKQKPETIAVDADSPTNDEEPMGDDNEEPEPSPQEGEQPLLFYCQTEQQ